MTKKQLILVVMIIKGSFIGLGMMVIIHKGYLKAQIEPADKPIWFDEAASLEDIKLAINRNPSDINAFNEDGRTGLMVAAVRRDIDRLQLFLLYGADVNIKALLNSNAPDEEGNTALHYACLLGNDLSLDSQVLDATPIVEALLNAGADAKAQNKQGNTPLHLVLGIDDNCKRLAIVRLLLAKGANLNAQNAMGETMAHLAVGQNDRGWLLLLQHVYGKAFDLTIKDNLGLNPIEAADQHYGYGDLASYLRGDIGEGTEPFDMERCLQ